MWGTSRWSDYQTDQIEKFPGEWCILHPGYQARVWDAIRRACLAVSRLGGLGSAAVVYTNEWKRECLGDSLIPPALHSLHLSPLLRALGKGLQMSCVGPGAGIAARKL